ncbi:hypothetical protein ACTWQL_17635 [Pseudalkalibacillus sp. R45]|uniref:hypothetical protein n=1 Tax=Pseudalkalibacillus sp. R45 TaxID=3457433 RepID=UPI003FCC3576
MDNSSGGKYILLLNLYKSNHYKDGVGDMREYNSLMKDEELDFFIQAVGLELKCIESNSVSFYLNLNEGSYSFYEPLLLQIDNYFLRLDCCEKETDDYEEYYHITCKKQDTPEPLQYEMNENNTFEYAVQPHSIISIFNKIIRVTIYTKEFQTENEQIVYDSSLIFDLDNGKRICLSPQPVMGFELTFDQQKMKSITEGYHKRMVLE